MYRKPSRLTRVTLAEWDEPDFWIEVENPESMTWKSRRRFTALTEADKTDPQVVAMAFTSLIRAWNIVDPETGEVLPVPPTAEDLDRLPAHVVDGILLAINEMNTVPK